MKVRYIFDRETFDELSLADKESVGESYIEEKKARNMLQRIIGKINSGNDVRVNSAVYEVLGEEGMSRKNPVSEQYINLFLICLQEMLVPEKQI